MYFLVFINMHALINLNYARDAKSVCRYVLAKLSRISTTHPIR